MGGGGGGGRAEQIQLAFLKRILKADLSYLPMCTEFYINVGNKNLFKV